MEAGSVKFFFLILILLTGNYSCRNKSEDNSLSVKEYIELGVPDPGKKWEMADYTQAHNALAKIKWERPLQLPVKDSKKSETVFERMLSLDYLSFLQDSAISLNEKAERISEFVIVHDYWIDIYTNPALRKKNYYHRELIDICIFDLQLKEEMLKLAHEINKSDDPSDVALQYGYNSIKMNYLSALADALKIQRHTSQFLEKDRERITDSIYLSVTRNREWMDDSVIIELKRSLQLVMDSASSNYIRNKYMTLEKVLSSH